MKKREKILFMRIFQVYHAIISLSSRNHLSFFPSKISIFLFYCALMTFSWKGFFSLLSKFLALFTQSTIGNSKISGYLCFTLPTGFKKIHSLLLEFFGVGRLRLAHQILLAEL